MLLYKKERDQYAEEVKGDVSPSTVYGAEHLLRLFGMSNCPLNEFLCVFCLFFDHFFLLVEMLSKRSEQLCLLYYQIVCFSSKVFILFIFLATSVSPYFYSGPICKIEFKLGK